MKAFAIITLLALISANVYASELQTDAIEVAGYGSIIGGALKIDGHIDRLIKSKGRELETLDLSEIENLKIGDILKEAGKIGGLLGGKELEDAEIQDFPLLPLIGGAIKVGSAIAGAVKGAKGKGKGKEIEAFVRGEIENMKIIGNKLPLERKGLEEAEIQDFPLIPLVTGAIKVGSAIAGAVKGAKGKGKGKEIEVFDLSQIEALDLNEIENFNVREFLQGIARINPMFGGKELEEAETEDFAILPLIGGAIKVGSMIAGAIKHKGKALEVEENFLA